MCVVVGYSLLIPLVLKWLASLSHRLMSITSIGTMMRYALRSLAANISRTSVAIAALVIAVSATAGVGIMIGSFRLSVSNWLSQALQADLYITVDASLENGLPDDLVDHFLSLSSVDNVRLSNYSKIETDAGRVGLLAIQVADEQRGGFTFIEKLPDHWQRFTSGEAVFVSEPFAWKHQLNAGDSIDLPTGRSLIAGITVDYGTAGGLVVQNLQEYQRRTKDKTLTTIGLHLKEGVDIETVKHKVRTLIEGTSQSLLLRSNIEIREQSLQIFDRTFAITHILRILTVGVAFVGILSALLALSLERSAEFATLRAIGLTPFELRKLVMAQCGLMGIIAGLLALPLGYVMSKMLIDVINQRSFGWTMGFHIPHQIPIQTIVLALGAALLAGWYPAARLSRMSPAEALREK